MISEYLKGDVIKYQLNSMFLIENYFVRNLNLLADLGGTFPCTPEALKLLIIAEIHIKVTKNNFFVIKFCFKPQITYSLPGNSQMSYSKFNL